MNAIVPFNFGDVPVRVEDRDGLPWFVLSDVCRVLEITNVGNAAARLDEDERDGIRITDAIGRDVEALAVNESGLWSLVLTSRKPAAKAFKRWVTSEVLPSLRQSGSYSLSSQPILPRDPRELIAYLNTQAKDMIGLQDQNAALAPKAEAFDRIADSHGSLTLTQASKVLKTTRAMLTQFMFRSGWIYRDRRDGRWLGYHPKQVAGLIEHRISRVPRSDGSERTVVSALLTPKGLTKLAEMLEAQA